MFTSRVQNSIWPSKPKMFYGAAFPLNCIYIYSLIATNNLSRPIYLKFIVITVINTDTDTDTVPEHSQQASEGLKSSHSVMKISSNSEYMLMPLYIENDIQKV